MIKNLFCAWLQRVQVPQSRESVAELFIMVEKEQKLFLHFSSGHASSDLHFPMIPPWGHVSGDIHPPMVPPSGHVPSDRHPPMVPPLGYASSDVHPSIIPPWGHASGDLHPPMVSPRGHASSDLHPPMVPPTTLFQVLINPSNYESIEALIYWMACPMMKLPLLMLLQIHPEVCFTNLQGIH